jgi:hypothetical protein
MCFTGEMSAGFAAFGLAAAIWVHMKTKNSELASGIFFFFTMEFLVHRTAAKRWLFRASL